MKKFVSTILVSLMVAQAVSALTVDTSEWVCTPDQLDITASEVDLKSDLKNSFRVYQTNVKNITTDTLDVTVVSNQKADESVAEILRSGLTLNELMAIPKQIAVDSYKEDVGDGKVATAHKSLICILASAGAVAAGAGLMGIYPQQKFEEYFLHKKIKKEYKKINGSLIGEFTLTPEAEREVLIFVPINNSDCIIKTQIKSVEETVYSDYHQL